MRRDVLAELHTRLWFCATTCARDDTATKTRRSRCATCAAHGIFSNLGRDLRTVLSGCLADNALLLRCAAIVRGHQRHLSNPPTQRRKDPPGDGTLCVANARAIDGHERAGPELGPCKIECSRHIRLTHDLANRIPGRSGTIQKGEQTKQANKHSA